MALNVNDLDFDNLSDDEKQYIRNTGNPDLMRRAGLMGEVDFDLSNVPGSLERHELEGEPMPVFDPESEVADESVGKPNDPRDLTLQPPPPGSEVKVETTPFEGSTAETTGKEQKEPEDDGDSDGAETDGAKPAAKKTAAKKTAVSGAASQDPKS